MNAVFPRLLSWVSGQYFQRFDTEVLYGYKRYECIVQTRGTPEAVKTWKLARLALMRYLSGSPLPRGSGVRTDKDGLPLLLGPSLRSAIKRSQCPEAIRAAMTLLTVSRKELGGTPVDFASIEAPSYANSDTIDLIMSMVPEILDHLQIKPYSIPDSTLTVEDFHSGLTRDQWSASLPFYYTTKSGPNGPALSTALEDFLALPSSLKGHLKTLEPRIAPILDCLDLHNVEALAAVIRRVSGCKLKDRKIRKLSVKSDKEMKSRVFAILDYFSQASLKGLHDYLLQVIKQIPADCAFDQLSGRSLKDVPGLKVSADLTAATDRFPLALQEKILTSLTNSDFALAWREVMVGYAFDYKGKPYHYGAGQPMGAHSSWALFSLAHHIVVQVAAKLSLGRFAGATDYRLLGDDIVLVGHEFSQTYIKLMEDLGVEINHLKTHSSESMFEFAKRLIVNGIEVSPYPVDGLVQSGKYYLLGGFVLEQLDRGFPLPPVRGPGSLATAIALVVGGHKSRLVKQLTRKAGAFIWFSRLLARRSDVVLQYDALIKWASYYRSVIVPCRTTITGMTPITKWIGMMLMKAFSAQVAQDASQVGRHYAVWRGELITLAKDLEGWSENPTLCQGPQSLSSGTGTFSLLGLVPVLGAVARLALKTTEAATGAPKLTKVDQVYPMIDCHQMTLLPKVKGVIPLRKKDIVLGTRAEFSNKVALEMELYWKKLFG